MKTFQVYKSWEYIASISALQEVVKEVFQQGAAWHHGDTWGYTEELKYQKW